jgi:hypothetical protein
VCLYIMVGVDLNREKEQGALGRGGTRPTRYVCDADAEASTSRRVAAPPVPFLLAASENVSSFFFFFFFFFFSFHLILLLNYSILFFADMRVCVCIYIVYLVFDLI